MLYGLGFKKGHELDEERFRCLSHLEGFLIMFGLGFYLILN